MAFMLQELFNRHFPAFASGRKLSRDMLHAAWMIQHCRTREMGGRVNSCPTGHFHQVAYNSCMHRCCPQCAWLPREQWLDGWKARLLPTPHHHVVFTIPHELNELWRYHKRLFTGLLFQAVSETLLELLDNPKYLGAKPGILAALHTWNQKLDIHIHLHVLVTAGGLTTKGEWATPTKSCLLPRTVLMLKFRGKFLALLREHVDRGTILLPPTMTRHQFDQLTWKLKRPWNVKIHQRYDHGTGVVTYLARYIKGGPLGKSRLIDDRDDRVRFRYRLSEREGGDGKATGVVDLPVNAFLARWLEHVPPRRLQTVRGFGLYSGNQYSRLDEARSCFGLQAQAVSEAVMASWQDRCEAAGMHDVCRCPKCGATLISHHEFASGRGPPRSAFRFRVSGQAA